MNSNRIVTFLHSLPLELALYFVVYFVISLFPQKMSSATNQESEEVDNSLQTYLQMEKKNKRNKK